MARLVLVSSESSSGVGVALRSTCPRATSAVLSRMPRLTSHREMAKSAAPVRLMGPAVRSGVLASVDVTVPLTR